MLQQHAVLVAYTKVISGMHVMHTYIYINKSGMHESPKLNHSAQRIKSQLPI